MLRLLAQLARLRRLGCADHVLRRNEVMIHEVVFSRANSKRRVRHRTPVADLTDDIGHVCSFASRDASLPYNTEDRVQSCLFVVGDTSWRSRLLQVSQLCQAVHLLNSVPKKTPQQVPSAHRGYHGLNLNQFTF